MVYMLLIKIKMGCSFVEIPDTLQEINQQEMSLTISNIPFTLTSFTKSDQDAQAYMSNPALDITRVVGHSLGRAVTHELGKIPS